MQPKFWELGAFRREQIVAAQIIGPLRRAPLLQVLRGRAQQRRRRTERASIQLRIRESEAESETVSVLVSPLTGKVTIKPGPVDLEIPTDDSDRQDTGY